MDYKRALARIFTIGHYSNVAEFRTHSDMVEGIVEFPESEPSSGEKGTEFKLFWDFRCDGLLRVSVFRRRNPPDDPQVRRGGSHLELVRSLSIDPKTGDVLPYYEAQQRMEKRKINSDWRQDSGDEITTEQFERELVEIRKKEQERE